MARLHFVWATVGAACGLAIAAGCGDDDGGVMVEPFAEAGSPDGNPGVLRPVDGGGDSSDSSLPADGGSTVDADAGADAGDAGAVVPCTVTTHAEPGAFACTGLRAVGAVSASYSFGDAAAPVPVKIVDGNIYVVVPILFVDGSACAQQAGPNAIDLVIDGKKSSFSFTIDPLTIDSAGTPGAISGGLLKKLADATTAADAKSAAAQKAHDLASLMASASAGPVAFWDVKTPKTCDVAWAVDPVGLRVADAVVRNTLATMPKATAPYVLSDCAASVADLEVCAALAVEVVAATGSPSSGAVPLLLGDAVADLARDAAATLTANGSPPPAQLSAQVSELRKSGHFRVQDFWFRKAGAVGTSALVQAVVNDLIDDVDLKEIDFNCNPCTKRVTYCANAGPPPSSCKAGSCRAGSGDGTVCAASCCP